MADYDSSLPVRTHEKDGDAVDANTPLFLVGGTDGTNYQALSTDNTGALNVNASLTWDDTNKVYIWDGTTDLSVAVDGSAAKTNGLQVLGTDGTNAQILSTDTSGVLNTNATIVWDDTNKVVITDGTNDLPISVDGAAEKTEGITVMGSDGTNNYTLLTDSNGALYVNTGGAPDDSVTYGTANLVKNTATTVVSQAGAAKVAGISASGSGRMKVEVKYGTTGSEAVIAVLFNSTANPNVEFTFPNALDVASGETILLSCTNLEWLPSPTSDFDGYGSIITTA